MPLARLAMPKGEMALHRSLTSGLTWRPGDPAGVFWGVGDRGPNLKPKDAVKHYGLKQLKPLAELDGAKIMPLPGTGPALARFRLDGGRIEPEALFELRYADGTLLGGLPPPAAQSDEDEPVFDLAGAPLSASRAGADSEGIAALPDGRFWIAEEYGPSLLLVDAEGVIERRVVPQGAGTLFAGSPAPVVEALPALARARKHNRGFEALALSDDGTVLYAAFQSPLTHPDRAAHDAGDVVRIWALDPLEATVLAEYAYPLAPPAAFARDCTEGRVERGDVKVSELAALPDGSLLVLERVTLSTHIYRVRPKTPVPPCYLDPDHRPSLEQLGQAGAATAGVTLLDKELVLSTDHHPEICADLEGMLVLPDGALLLANDSDYGTEGAGTQFWRVDPR